MINPHQLVTRLRVIVERRINLDAEFVPALEARDIQREINQMLEQYIAEQQPSVKAGQGHIEPVMTEAKVRAEIREGT
jgi:hypothetical protein